ncbi:MAG: hypothetical protein RLZZ453_842 [Chlamydiota bacterium]|jgi:thiol peroxidase
MVTVKGKPVKTAGHVPQVHMKAPGFRLVGRELKEHSLEEFKGKKKVIATVPSLDTGTCSTMTKHFNTEAKKHPNAVFITVSCDLPFAHNRFCEQENVHNVITLSCFRSPEFGKSYGVLLEDGPIAGLLARAVFVLDEKDHVLYVEVVPEISEEPHYHKAIEALR